MTADLRGVEDDGHVAFGRGHAVLLYIVYRGRESNHLERRVTHLVQEIETQFASVLSAWNGDMDRIGRLREYLMNEWDLHPREPPREPTAALAR